MIRSLFSWPVALCLLLLVTSFWCGLYEPTWKFLFLVSAGLLGIMLVYVLLRRPSHERNWEDSWLRLPRAEIDGDRITIRDFRDFKWRTANDYDAVWCDRRFHFSKLEGLNLIVHPFGNSSLLAHVFLAFDFGEEGRLLVSPEARREKGEIYGVVKGAMRQFELIYLLGSEEDFLMDRCVVREGRVFDFPVRATPGFRESLLRDLLATTNRIFEKPEFYNSIRRNCMTVLVDHIDALRPQEPAVGMRLGTIFPAKAGKLLHGYGFMDTGLDYASAEKVFRIDVDWRNRVHGEPDSK